MARKNIDYKSLTDLLRQLDKDLSNYSNVKLVAIGGTALNLMGLKRRTLDVDFILENDDPILKADITCNIFNQGYDCQIQDRGKIVSYNLPTDYFSKAIRASDINKSLNHIEVYIMDPIDLAISKLARYNDADQLDIIQLIKHFNPSWRNLKHRFNQFYNGYQGNKANLQSNFTAFSSLFKELKRKKKT